MRASAPAFVPQATAAAAFIPGGPPTTHAPPADPPSRAPPDGFVAAQPVAGDAWRDLFAFPPWDELYAAVLPWDAGGH
jgi:hypothetical protein